MTGVNIKKIIETIKQAKKRILISLVILALVIVGLILLSGKVSRSVLRGAIFYFRGEGKDSKLFYIKPSNELQHLIILPSEEGEPGKYKVPRHSYISHNGNVLIYFEKTGQTPLESENKDFTMYRIIYKPKYVDLKSGSVRDIDQDIDAGSLVFSPNDQQIAWVLSVKESTIQELESAGRKREVWLSNRDGSNARRLTTLNDKVVLLQKWDGDYIYLWAVKGVGYYSLGRIDIKSGQVKYVQPKFCSESLTNCQNFSLSPSGELFLYEAARTENSKQIIELFVGDFSGKKSWQILVKNYVSDRLWMPDEKNIIYTEQITPLAAALSEKIHLVNLETHQDQEIYSGSYVSQLVPDSQGNYLYFIEKETDQKFNLVRLNIKTKKSEIIESGEYNQMQIFSGN